jgi:hypothetical protein
MSELILSKICRRVLLGLDYLHRERRQASARAAPAELTQS